MLKTWRIYRYDLWLWRRFQIWRATCGAYRNNDAKEQLQKELADGSLEREFLDSPAINSSDLIDCNGVVSQPGHLSEKQIWKHIWGG